MKNIRLGSSLILAIVLVCASVPVSIGEDAQFAGLPQFAVLKAKIYKNIGAEGYVINTDARGQIVSTTDASDYVIQNVNFDKNTKIASVTVVDTRYTVVFKQEWQYEKNDWVLHDPDREINKLRQTK